MTSHKQRMAEIGIWAIPPIGSSTRNRLDARLEEKRNDPRFKKAIKQTYDKAVSLLSVQIVNGAGFLADKQLREYNSEYNNRVFNHTLYDMPGSFNVMEAFNQFLPPSATFELREENDHLFSFQHFIDWVTSSVDDDHPDLHKLLIEGKIYSYNTIDSPSELCFSIEGGDEFGFGSISLIRFDNEVSLILLAGQKTNLDDQSKNILKKWENMEALSHRVHIKPDKALPLHAEPLLEGHNLWKTVVLLRFDIQRKTIDARYVFKDCGRSYEGQTDDLSSYMDEKGDFISEKVKNIYEKSLVSIEKYVSLFELSKTCLLLPKFFQNHEEDISVERHPTEFKDFRKKLINKKVLERVAPRFHISYRDVRVLPRPIIRSPDRAKFVAPEYKVETTGFWRNLPINAEGCDKSGKPIHGRTWVSQTLSWVEESSSQTSIVTKNSPTPSGQNPGYIYVMRSAAHGRDIFKVGLTRRTANERAKELSSTTSSPDHFLVVEEWGTNDCVRAEKLIHSKLSAYRINPNREYFKARYSVIFAAIDEVISEIETIGV